MSRKNYDEIKKKFGQFIDTWKTRKIDVLETIFDKDVICFLSTVKAYPCGSQHSLFGIKNFVNDIPKSDVFHSRICNYACRIGEGEAQQVAHVVCVAAKFEKGSNEPKTFEFTAMFANHWIIKEKGWLIDEIRMDLVKHGGDLESFEEAWYFDIPNAKWYPGVHFPCILGELDSPWNKIKNPVDCGLSDKEQIMEVFAKYAYAIDHNIFGHMENVLTEDVTSIMPPWGDMTKRKWIEALKFHRQCDRYWTHPGKLYEVIIENDKAHAVIYRMSGHNQKTHPYHYTKANIDIEHACARYVFDFRKEEGAWKIFRCRYYLGFVELGKYQDDLYDDTEK